MFWIGSSRVQDLPLLRLIFSRALLSRGGSFRVPSGWSANRKLAERVPPSPVLCAIPSGYWREIAFSQVIANSGQSLMAAQCPVPHDYLCKPIQRGGLLTQLGVRTFYCFYYNSRVLLVAPYCGLWRSVERKRR